MSFARGWDPLRPDDFGTLWEHLVLEHLHPSRLAATLAHETERTRWSDRKLQQLASESGSDSRHWPVYLFTTDNKRDIFRI